MILSKLILIECTYLDNKKEVAGLFFICGSKNSQKSVNVCEVIMNTFKPICLVIELRQSVSRAVNNPKDLRH